MCGAAVTLSPVFAVPIGANRHLATPQVRHVLPIGDTLKPSLPLPVLIHTAGSRPVRMDADKTGDGTQRATRQIQKGSCSGWSISRGDQDEQRRVRSSLRFSLSGACGRGQFALLDRENLAGLDLKIFYKA